MTRSTPTTNEICFPAAILQPPFFDPTADDAANYGAIGGIIGHEMSHGFDVRTKVLADWFSQFEVLPGVKVNGQQTLGENIGDNGGLNIAFRALQNSPVSLLNITVKELPTFFNGNVRQLTGNDQKW